MTRYRRQPEPVQFSRLLEGTKQYQVPLYQRTYSWKRAQLERLWRDILQLAEDRATNPDLTHFIGSLVLAPSPANGPAGVMEFLVVDGQQRLTTLTLLLCAIRDHRAQTENPEHRERINDQYLINRWKPERSRLKLLPTQADRASYCILPAWRPHLRPVELIRLAPHTGISEGSWNRSMIRMISPTLNA